MHSAPTRPHCGPRSTRRALLSACAALLAAAPLHAQDDAPNDDRTTVLEFGVDSDGTGANGAYASIDVPFGRSDSISAAVGHTNFDDFTVLRANGSIAVVDAKPAERIALGYRHGFGSVGLNFNAERWGNNDLVRIDDISAGLDFQTENSTWFFDAINRSSQVTVDFLPGGPRHGDVNAWGVDGGFGYLTDPADIYVSLAYYDYGNDLELGPLAARLGTFSPISVADSLVERSALIGGRHQFAVWSFGMEAGWYRGAIDGVETRTLATVLGFPISHRLDLDLTLGAVDADEVDTTGYGMLSLRIALGGG
jgi:hypothetical protein